MKRNWKKVAANSLISECTGVGCVAKALKEKGKRNPKKKHLPILTHLLFFFLCLQMGVGSWPSHSSSPATGAPPPAPRSPGATHPSPIPAFPLQLLPLSPRRPPLRHPLAGRRRSPIPAPAAASPGPRAGRSFPMSQSLPLLSPKVCFAMS
jgi:hypothetical protein